MNISSPELNYQANAIRHGHNSEAHPMNIFAHYDALKATALRRTNSKVIAERVPGMYCFTSRHPRQFEREERRGHEKIWIHVMVTNRALLLKRR